MNKIINKIFNIINYEYQLLCYSNNNTPDKIVKLNIKDIPEKVLIKENKTEELYTIISSYHEIKNKNHVIIWLKGKKEN